MENKDPIISNMRTGKQDNPYIEINEPLIIDNSGTVQLNEYPYRYNRVVVTGDNKDWYETESDLPNESEFRVDYEHKYVIFNIANIGKQLNFKYTGMGNSFFPASSIYVERDGLTVIETLDSLTKTTAQVRDEAQGAAEIALEAAGTIDEAVTKADDLAQNTRYIQPYDSATTYQKNNIVSYGGSSFMAKKVTVGNEPPNPLESTENEFWGLVSRKGADGTGTVKTRKEVFIATEGQTVFDLQYTYDQFQDRTTVVVGGVQQSYPLHYEETSDKSITLSEGVPEGTEVIVEYFSESVPLESDIQTTVDNHTNVINDHTAKINENSNKIGVLSGLETEDKSNLVNAVNEVVNEITNTEQNIINLNNDKIAKVDAPFISISEFNVINDGVTENTISFQNASLHNDIAIPEGTFILSENVIGDFKLTKDAKFPNGKAIDIQAFIKECINFLTERLGDDYNQYHINGNRRKVQVRKPDATYTYNTDIVPDNGINATSSAMTLELIAKYLKHYPSERTNLIPTLEEVAQALMSLQWKDERTTRYGGFKNADNLNTARTFTTGKAMLGLLEAYEVTNNPKYLAACEKAAVFLGVMANPNPVYQAKYGVTPIPEVTLNANFKGFCDQIQANDTIHVTSTTWNLVATKALFKLWKITGNQSYKDLCDQTRDYHAYGVINGYDYFAIRNTNPPAMVSNSWPNEPSGISGDGAWHRLGDYVNTGSLGTDQIEYGLDALWVTGYDEQSLKDAYEFYCGLPSASPDTSFGANYDAEVCWTGYFRINSPEYGGESKAYGSYYDSQGAGCTLAFKKALYPDHYKKTTALLAVLPYSGALLDENYNTIYSTGSGYLFATKGVIPIASAGIGLLDGLEVQ